MKGKVKLMKTMTDPTLQAGFREILPAAGRAADVPEADDLYGFLIGSWDLDVAAFPDEGDKIESKGEAHASWVLEGRAIQDLFINPRRADRKLGLAALRKLVWHDDTNLRPGDSRVARDLAQPARWLPRRADWTPPRQRHRPGWNLSRRHQDPMDI